MGVQKCSFCGNVSPQQPAQSSSERQLQTSGDGNVVVQDASGNKAGIQGGQAINDIPGAEVQPTLSDAPAYWARGAAPHFSLPAAGALTVTLDGSGLTNASPSGVTLFGPGFVLGVADIHLDPKQKDTLTFSGDNSEITYKTAGQETPTITLGVQLAGADYLFDVRAHGDATGLQLDMKMDLAGGKLRMGLTGAAGSGYDVEVHRIDDAGDQTFSHFGNTANDGDLLYLDYGSWQGNGTPMSLEVDQGGNGSIDITDSLGDQG